MNTNEAILFVLAPAIAGIGAVLKSAIERAARRRARGGPWIPGLLPGVPNAPGLLFGGVVLLVVAATRLAYGVTIDLGTRYGLERLIEAVKL